MIRVTLGIALASAILPGCTSLGGSIQGDFTCRAAQGTCAPLTVNDDAAMAGMRPAEPRATRARPIAGTRVIRTPERLLTILVPAHVDQDGVLHDAATVHAVAEPARWGDHSADMSNPEHLSPRSHAPSLRGVIGDALALPVEGLGSSPARAPQTFPEAPQLPAREAARAGHRIARPSLLERLPSRAGEPEPNILRSSPVPLSRAPLTAPAPVEPSHPEQSR